jgi:hypothetical protein
MFYIYIFFFKENAAVYEAVWKNTVGADRPHMIVCVILRIKYEICILNN